MFHEEGDLDDVAVISQGAYEQRTLSDIQLTLIFWYSRKWSF